MLYTIGETAKKKGSVDVMKNIPDEEIPEKLRSVKDKLERVHKLA